MKRQIRLVFVLFSLVLAVSCQKPEMSTMNKPICIDFPLRGVWISPNTPGKKIPSHGIDKYGETYAYDFVGVSQSEKIDKFYHVSALSYFINGVPLDQCYGWGSEIYAPFDGKIVKVEDGVIERNPVMLKNDLKYMKEITRLFQNGEAKYCEVAGNYIIIQYSENVFALFAHLKSNSICVKEGENVKIGQLLGRVGHSENSTAPHLHFQLMDNIDPRISNGIPCSFSNYNELINNKWVYVTNGIPSKYRIMR
jgi:hypothetical protein